jgi:sulfite exporter TauE/SafE
MVTTYALAFVAGLLGGAHCLGMCGGFVMAAGGPRAWLFHVGRLAGYGVLGAVAGLAGAALDLGGAAAGLHRLRFIVSGTLLLAFGMAFLGFVPRRWLEPSVGGAAALIARARRASGPGFPFLLGLPIGLLPCGLLYPMYAAAAGTGSALSGATLLLTFGLGTVPLLAAFALALERVAQGARRNLVRAAGVAMLVLGSLMVWRGWSAGTGAAVTQPPARHEAPARGP